MAVTLRGDILHFSELGASIGPAGGIEVDSTDLADLVVGDLVVFQVTCLNLFGIESGSFFGIERMTTDSLELSASTINTTDGSGDFYPLTTVWYWKVWEGDETLPIRFSTSSVATNPNHPSTADFYVDVFSFNIRGGTVDVCPFGHGQSFSTAPGSGTGTQGTLDVFWGNANFSSSHDDDFESGDTYIFFVENLARVLTRTGTADSATNPTRDAFDATYWTESRDDIVEDYLRDSSSGQDHQAWFRSAAAYHILEAQTFEDVWDNHILVDDGRWDVTYTITGTGCGNTALHAQANPARLHSGRADYILRVKDSAAEETPAQSGGLPQRARRVYIAELPYFLRGDIHG